MSYHCNILCPIYRKSINSTSIFPANRGRKLFTDRDNIRRNKLRLCLNVIDFHELDDQNVI